MEKISKMQIYEKLEELESYFERLETKIDNLDQRLQSIDSGVLSDKQVQWLLDSHQSAISSITVNISTLSDKMETHKQVTDEFLKDYKERIAEISPHWIKQMNAKLTGLQFSEGGPEAMRRLKKIEENIYDLRNLVSAEAAKRAALALLERLGMVAIGETEEKEELEEREE